MYGAEIGEFVCGWSKTLSTGAAWVSKYVALFLEVM